MRLSRFAWRCSVAFRTAESIASALKKPENTGLVESRSLLVFGPSEQNSHIYNIMLIGNNGVQYCKLKSKCQQGVQLNFVMLPGGCEKKDRLDESSKSGLKEGGMLSLSCTPPTQKGKCRGEVSKFIKF